MRDKPSPELMRALETLGKRSVQPPATPQEPALPSGSPDGYMESLMARRKAVKLLEALAESCDRPDGEDDHDWHQCRSCVAAFSLTQTGAKALLRSLLAELTRASTPSPERQTWPGAEKLREEWEWMLTGVVGELDSVTLSASILRRWLATLPSPPTPEGTQP